MCQMTEYKWKERKQNTGNYNFPISTLHSILYMPWTNGMKRICSRWHVALWLAVALLTTSILQNGILFHFLPTRNQTKTQLKSPLNSNTSQLNVSNQRISINSSINLVISSQLSLESLLHRKKQCIPGPSQPLEQVSSFPNYANASSYWNHSSSKEEVVCEFNKDQPSVTHFPHTMQQLYGCFSLWQEYPSNQPILLVSKQVEKKLKRNHFLNGIFQIFQSQLKVEVLSKKEYVERKHYNGELPKLQKLDVRGGYILNQAVKLNHLATKEFRMQTNNPHSCTGNRPRIGVLNRRISAGRSIINAELLVITPSVTDLSRNNSVLVEYFEGLSFVEQVSFFRSIDILIAAHGAQLTGVAFMNAPCSHLVELFPKVSFFSVWWDFGFRVVQQVHSLISSILQRVMPFQTSSGLSQSTVGKGIRMSTCRKIRFATSKQLRFRIGDRQDQPTFVRLHRQ